MDLLRGLFRKHQFWKTSKWEKSENLLLQSSCFGIHNTKQHVMKSDIVMMACICMYFMYLMASIYCRSTKVLVEHHLSPLPTPVIWIENLHPTISVTIWNCQSCLVHTVTSQVWGAEKVSNVKISLSSSLFANANTIIKDYDVLLLSTRADLWPLMMEWSENTS